MVRSARHRSLSWENTEMNPNNLLPFISLLTVALVPTSEIYFLVTNVIIYWQAMWYDIKRLYSDIQWLIIQTRLPSNMDSNI